MPVTDRQLTVFENAAALWVRNIIKEVLSINTTLPSACEGPPPKIDGGTIDDIVIEVVMPQLMIPELY